MASYGKFSQHVSLSCFSPYSLFGNEFELFASIQQDVMIVTNLDDSNVWIQACEQCATLFWCVMPMVMENLAIAQQWDTLHYAIFMEVVIGLKFVNLNKRIMLQQKTSITLDVITSCVILHVW